MLYVHHDEFVFIEEIVLTHCYSFSIRKVWTVYRSWSPWQIHTPIGWQAKFLSIVDVSASASLIDVHIDETISLNQLLYNFSRSNIQSLLSQICTGCFANLMIVHISLECMASPAISFWLSGHELGCYADLIIVIDSYRDPGMMVITRKYISSHSVTREPECS